MQQFNRSQAERLERDIDQLKVQIQAAEDRKIYLEGQLATVNPDSPVKEASPQTRLSQLKVALCDLQARFPDNHPEIRKAKREIAELEKITGGSAGGSSQKKEKLAKLQAELAEKQGRYSDQHPEVIKLKKEIAELEKIPDSPQTGQGGWNKPENPAYINLQTNIQID